MGEEQRRALARLFAENEDFTAAMTAATSVDDAVRIAGQFGVAATAEDFAPPDADELADSQLEAAAGGYPVFQTVFCPGSWVCPLGP